MPALARRKAQKKGQAMRYTLTLLVAMAVVLLLASSAM